MVAPLRNERGAPVLWERRAVPRVKDSVSASKASFPRVPRLTPENITRWR